MIVIRHLSNVHTMRVTFRADTQSYCWFSHDVTKIQNTDVTFMITFMIFTFMMY